MAEDLTVFEMWRALYFEVILGAAAVQVLMPDAITEGAQRIVDLCRPWNEAIGQPEDAALDYVYRSIEFHLAVEFSTPQTTVDAAAYLVANTDVRPSGSLYAYKDYARGARSGPELGLPER